MKTNEIKNKEPVLWLNNGLVELSQARVSPLDRGLLYGDGIFETIRSQDGNPLFLAGHLARLAASARELNLGLDPALNLGEIMGQVCQANGLAQGLAKVKIVLTRGVGGGLGLPAPDKPTLMVMAEAYTPPTPAQYAAGWRLKLVTQGYAPPLARHKSLNYLFFLAAKQAAATAGATEPVLLDPQGRVTETATGALIYRLADRWHAPKSAFKLPSTMLAEVEGLLKKAGEQVTPRQTTPQDLAASQTIWVLNSLMGVMPATWFEGNPLPEPRPGQAASLRDRLFGG